MKEYCAFLNEKLDIYNATHRVVDVKKPATYRHKKSRKREEGKEIRHHFSKRCCRRCFNCLSAMPFVNNCIFSNVIVLLRREFVFIKNNTNTVK